MAKKKTKAEKEQDRRVDAEIRAAMTEPWLKMRTGLIVITLTSIAMAVFTAWNLWPSMEWWEAIGWGLLFGAAIWAIFFAGIWLNRFFQRGVKKE